MTTDMKRDMRNVVTGMMLVAIAATVYSPIETVIRFRIAAQSKIPWCVLTLCVSIFALQVIGLVAMHIRYRMNLQAQKKFDTILIKQ
ncbi:MAG: hypothetical protein JWM56_516 [Candidatus Peribacteria bacterium]|nr:hypothetical protein [Candidatus Peribacteria bacterium]